MQAVQAMLHLPCQGLGDGVRRVLLQLVDEGIGPGFAGLVIGNVFYPELPVGQGARFVEHHIADAAEYFQRLPSLHQDAVAGQPPDAYHDGGGRGQARQVQRPREAAAASAAAPSQVAAAQAGLEQVALEARSLARSADEAPASALPAADNGAAGPFAAVLTQAGGTTGDAASAPAGSASLTAPLASPEWQKGLEQQVLGLHQRGEQRIELHLHPAELGPLSISLQLGESGAQAQFLSSHPQVRAAVEQAIPQLRETLAQQGITLGETSVGEQQYRSPQEQFSGGNGGSFAGNGNGSGTSVADASLESRSVAVPLSLNGGIDLYA